jgi:parallel beta-helix repeat protein
MQSSAKRTGRPVRAAKPVPAHPRVRPTTPFPRKPVFEELERRLLMSADINPAVTDALLAPPAPGGAEFRALAVEGSAVTDAEVAPIRRTTELVFVDPRVPDRAQLVAGLVAESATDRHIEVIALDPARDGIAQVTDALKGRVQIDAVHFITHGTDGAVQLGGTWLDAKALAANTETIGGWGNALKEDADLLFYGCDLAASARGRALVEWLAELTKADVAASTDATGAVRAGGDWDLEATVGVVETALAVDRSARESWSHRLGAVAVGLDFPVNSTTPSVQTEAAIARDATGNFVVVWASDNQDGSNFGVYAQRFDSSGVAQGPEFRVNTEWDKEQQNPAVAMDDNGNFVVAWQSKDQDSSGYGVYAQRYNAAGVAQGSEFRVNTFTTNDQQNPAVAMDANGDFVVVWQSNNEAGDNGWGIYAQRYNAAGVAQGGAFRVNTYTTDQQENPAVAMDDIGNFVVVWQSKNQDGDAFGIYAQRYNAAGVAQGSEFRANSFTTKDQQNPAVALDADGDFVIAWESDDQAADKWDIYARRYSAAGAPQSAGEFRVNSSFNNEDQRAPSVAISAAGEFTIAWQSNNQDGDKWGIYARNYGATGAPDGPEFLVNTHTPNDQQGPAIAINTQGPGHFVVAWTGEGFGDGDGVFARLYAASTSTISGTIFHDVDGDADVAEVGTLAFAGATVSLYRDDGDGAIGTADVFVTSTSAIAGGAYNFIGLADGTYYVVVDSKSLGAPNVWAEQTYGVAGAAQGAGFTLLAGALYGGRDANSSDNASALTSAEHVTRVTLGGANVAGVDSGFSYNAIVNNRGDAADDDAANPRLQQGTLRQFILNSNALAGTQTANFSIGATGSAQSIAVTGAGLPAIIDTVVLDAWTQAAPGYTGPPLIELNGAGAGPSQDGFLIAPTAGGSMVRGFIINRFGGDGLHVEANDTIIVGNYIGTDASGGAAAGNSSWGVHLLSDFNRVGGTGAGERNVIAGNLNDGVFVDGSTGNAILGNHIGINAAGTAALGNAGNGVEISGGGTSNNVGGTTVAARNVISGNSLAGIWLEGAGTTGNVLLGNYIGLDAAGTTATPNAESGVWMSGASGNTIGGTAPGARNVISGNLVDGITGIGSSGNLIQGNYVGTDVTGTLAIGNREDGVYLQDGSNNTVGGTSAAARNVLSGNSWSGLTFYGTGSGNVAQGNFIGTDATGTGPLGNLEQGVLVWTPGPTTIGGPVAGAGNRIAYNGWDGVEISAGVGHSVLGNSIYQNGDLGIDLGAVLGGDGPTPNDAGDGDLGTNSLQNFAVLTGAATNGTTVTIAGSLDSVSGASYRVEFFANGPTGQRYLGFTTVPIGAASTATFSATLTAAVAIGETVTATATGPGGSTSEFSASVTATAGAAISGTIYHDVDGNANVTDDAGAVFAGVDVRLHLDDGDAVIDSGDSFVNAVTTTGSGSYSFGGLAAGTYYVVVNSRTLSPDVNVWGEQTYAVTGAASGASFTPATGALYGGRERLGAGTSDNAAGSITTAEHVTKVTLAGGNVTDVNSGFSFNAIVNNRGDTADEDGAVGGRLQQGSLRQFILNANALTGTQIANFSIGGGGPQTINVSGAALPTITQAVILDAAATQEGFSGTPIVELNGAAVSGSDGLTITAGGSTVRGFAINRFHEGIVLSGGGGNTIAGNYLGTDLTGSIDRGNQYGVRIASSGNFIGGLTPADRNVVSGNDIDGIWVSGASDNLIRGNYIGLDASGSFALGNNEDGVWLDGSSGNTVGGTTVAERNIISGNGWSGIDVSSGGSGNVIQGNHIGINAFGGALGNLNDGVRIRDGIGHQVGGTATGAGNLIAHNFLRGVAIDAGSGHSVLGNSIYSNGGIGIDLGNDGTTFNDPGDVDLGANLSMNFPVLYSAVVSGGTVTVTGEARPGARVQFFEAAPDPSGAGEGQTFLFEAIVSGVTPGTSDPTARQFSFTFAAGPVVIGSALTATATDAANNTSEFSFNAVAAANTPPVANDVFAAGAEDDAQIAITLSGSDVEGPVASFRLAALPANGVLYTDAALTITAAVGSNYPAAGNALTLYFVPAANWNGIASFQFTATDASGLDDATPATATISVAAQNDAPSNAVPATISVTEDVASPITGIAIADLDVGAGALVVTLSAPSGTLAAASGGGVAVVGSGSGTLTLAGTLADLNTFLALPSVSFITAAGATAPVILTVTTNDQGNTGAGGAQSDSDPITLNVVSVNDAPQGTDTTVSTPEDTAYTFAMADFGFSDPGDAPANVLAAVRIASLPAAGTLTLNATGVIAGDLIAVGDIGAGLLVFTPFAGANGVPYASFSFQVQDDGGVAAGGVDLDPTPNTLTINVTAVNDEPVANDVSASGNEDDAQIAITLTGSDLEGPLASFRLATLPANGLLYTDARLTTLALTGTDYAAAGNALTLYFVPAANWNGSTTFQFTATDGGGLSDASAATATVNVAPVNDTPAAVGDAAATNENIPVTSGNVLANDSLGDAPTTIVAFDALSVQGGTVVLGAGAFTYTPAASFSGTDTFSYTIQDNDGERSTATVTVTVANVANDPPVNIVPGAQISAEDTALVFSTGTGNRIGVSDPDVGASPLEVTLTAVQGTLTLAGTAGLTFTVGTGTADATMTFTGTAAAINAALDGMSFLPPLDYSGPASVTITTNDLGASGAGGPQSDTDTVNITVVIVDDSPVLDLDANNSSGALGADYVRTFTEGLGSVRIADFDATLTDNDSANLASLTVTITNLLDGVVEVLTADTTGTSITATFVPGSGVLTLNGADTVANYQTVLRTIRYENLSDAPNVTQRVITFVASDGGSGSNVGTTRVTIAAVNDAPIADIAAASYAATENVTLTLHGTGMSVADIDALPASIMTVQLSSISGLLSATAGTTGVTIAGSGSPTLTLTGTLTQVNTLLAGGASATLLYTVGSDSPAPTDTLDLSITDNGATGAGGAQFGWDSVTVNLTAVNDAPLITIPGTASTPEDTSLVFSSGGGNLISITDVDAGGAAVRVTLNVSTGLISLAGTAGLGFTVGDGTADASMIFTGTVAAINAALDGVVFAPPANFNGSAFLSISVDDQGNSGLGGALADADFSTITVTGVNDAPDGADATVTTPQDTPYVLAAANFGFTDGDAGDTLAAVRIDALPGAGTLILSGLAVTAGQVVAVADINAGNLVFTPAPGGTGVPYASFAFSVQDSGGAFDAVANTLTVNVATPVNNPPTGTNGTVTTAPSTDYVFTLADFGYSDPDAGDAFSAVRIDTLPSLLAGTLYFGALPLALPGNVLSASGIAAGNLHFRPALLFVGTASFDFSVRDTNGPAFDVAPNTMQVNVVVPTNDPVNVVPGPKAVNEDTALAITGLSVNDPNGDLTSVQLTVLNGTLSALPSGTATVGGSGSASVTISGTQADINASLASLNYQGALDYSGADTLTVRSTDAGGLFDQDNVAITVSPVNDAPLAAAPLSYVATEQSSLTLHGTGLAVADVDAGLNSVTATLSAVTGAIFVNPGTTGVLLGGFGTPLVTLTGNVGAINTLLAGGSGATVTYLVTTDSPPASDMLTLTISDGGASGAGGPHSASASSTITIGAVNDAPVNTLPGGSTTLEDNVVLFSAAGGNQISITDVDAGSAPVQLTLSASNGVITLGGTGGLAFTSGDGTADTNMTFTGTLSAINAALNGFVFTPNLDYNGLAFIQLTTNDLGSSGAGGPLADTDLATIDVLPVNDAPDGTDTTVTLNEDSTYTFGLGDFGFTDVDFGDAMTEVRIDTVALPGGATLQLAGANVTPGQVISVASITAGNLVFTPVPDANGAGYASFTFSVRDTGVPPGPLFDAVPNTMTVDVAPVNDLPVITSDGGGATAALVVAENTTAVTTATATDIDLQPLTFSLAGVDAARFSIDSVTGVLTFNAAPNFEAPTDAGGDNVYNVTVRVSDGAGGVDTQALTITVTDANDAPSASGDAYVTDEDLPLSIAAAGVLGNDGDEDGAPVTAVLDAGPANGSVAFNADGSFVYTPNANFFGVDTFTYQATDGALGSAAATVTITVNPINDAPSGADSNVTVAAAYAFTVADFNYVDVDGDPLDRIMITALPVEGQLLFDGLAVTLNQEVTAAELAAGRLTYVPPTTSTAAAASFAFSVSDGTLYEAASHTMTVGFASGAILPPPPPPPPPTITPPPAPPAEPPAEPPPAEGAPAEPGGDAPAGGGRGGGGGSAGGDSAAPPPPPAADAGAAAAETGQAAAGVVATAAQSIAGAAPTGSIGFQSGGVASNPGAAAPANPLESRGEPPAGELKAEMETVAAMAAPEVRQALDEARERVQEEAKVEARVAGSVFVVSTGLSVGYVLWLLRGGALIASLLSSLPAWRLVDPLPVLGSMGGRAGGEDDDSLEDLVADDRNAESAPGQDETAENDNVGSVRT